MKSPTLQTTEEISSGIKNPVLIVDKEGVLGKELVLKLGKDVQAVFVTHSKPFLPSEYVQNIIHVPFAAKFPTIPEATYSYIFIIDDRLSHVRELLPSFIEKAEKDKIPVLFVAFLSALNEDFLTSIKEKYPRLKVLLCGDIFDKNLSLDQNALVNRFLYETFTYEKIEVPGNGMIKTYPVYIDDVVSSMLEVMFGSHLENLFLVFPKHPPTALSVARAIQKAKPEVKVDFASNQKEVETNTGPSFGIYLLEDNYPLDERIKRVVQEGPKHELDIRDFERYKEQKAKASKTKDKSSVWSTLFSLIFLLLIPLITTLCFSLLAFFALLQTQSNLSRGNIDAAVNWANSSSNFFSFASASFQPLYFQANLIGLKDRVFPIGQNIDVGKDVSKASLSFADAYKKMSAVLSGKSNNAAKDFSDANLELSDALVLIRKIEGNKDVDKSIIAKIQEDDGLFNFVANMQTVLPQLIGVTGRRTYLFLFQNNMELRPTGGFIGSYGLLNLASGKVESFSVSDVYDADGQLKGHVEPPFAIRRYLPSQHWYLRDSNFDLDFPKAASAAAFFLKTEKGQDVAGVVGIDVSFVQKILKATGPVHVSEYNQDIDVDNFFKLAQEHSEKNFFPGSTQKKDFLGAVFRALQNRLSEQKNISYLSLAKVVVESITTKDILLASGDSSVQGLFTVDNYSSSLFDNREQKTGTVNDYLGINEANLGVNKVNYFIERKVSQNTIVSDDGKISSELSISYTNKSDGQWPGGDYKNYLRIIVPAGAVLSSVGIDGKVQKTTDAITDPQVYEQKGFTPPADLEVEKIQQDGKQVWGLLLNIPANSKKTIVFDYTLSDKLAVGATSVSYSLKVLKQPGVDSLPFDFSFSYPTSASIVSVSSGLAKQSGSVILKKNVLTDENFAISLARNE